MKVLKSIEMIKSRVYLHPGRWIKHIMVFILSINLLFLFSLFEENNIAFGATILSHGMCESSEVPEEFKGTPPTDRRDFEAGEEVCIWLMIHDINTNYRYEVSSEWYQPDGLKLNPTRTHFHLDRNVETDTLLMSSCLVESGNEGIVGIPDVPGEWTVKVFDNAYYAHDFLYDEIFTVIGDGSVTTTTTTADSSTTTTGDDTTTTVDGDTSTTSTGNFPATTTSTPPCSLETIYGEHSEQTELLRYIRDNVFAHTPEGREIINLYYQWSPAIVQAMENDAAFKEEVKEMVDGVLELIE